MMMKYSSFLAYDLFRFVCIIAEQLAASISRVLSYTLDRQRKVLRNVIADIPIQGLIFHTTGISLHYFNLLTDLCARSR
jgi:hypothetical protein